jgi:hypothetical protein
MSGRELQHDLQMGSTEEHPETLLDLSISILKGNIVIHGENLITPAHNIDEHST